jgi:hypothetical protein
MNTPKAKPRRIYLNTNTGLAGFYEDWDYDNDNGSVGNSVDDGDAIEVIRAADHSWVVLP